MAKRSGLVDPLVAENIGICRKSDSAAHFGKQP
jgi:hypothetical protein